MKNKRYETIAATELVRNFAAVIDKVRISGCSLYITKGIQTIAELRPPPRSGFPIKNLAEFMEALPGLKEDAKTMLEDLKTIKSKAQLPRDPWD